MKKLIATLILLAGPSLAVADNYAECLLDKLPGVQNQSATIAAVRLCEADYPGGFASVKQGTGRGFFASYDSGHECVLDMTSNTRHQRAASIISSACFRLYNKPPKPAEPNYFDQFDPPAN